MLKIIFITLDGKEIIVNTACDNLMEVAVENSIAGVEGDCQGVGSCGTCHVHVDAEWMERVGPASELERDLINLKPSASPCSRLACQIELTEKLDGLIVRIPDPAPSCLSKAFNDNSQKTG